MSTIQVLLRSIKGKWTALLPLYLRMGNQGLQSIVQLLTMLIFLKVFSVEEFGVYSLLLIFSQFCLGIGTNGYLYALSFKPIENTNPFLATTVVFLLIESLVITVFGVFIETSILLCVYIILRSQILRLQEFYNRLSYQIDNQKLLQYLFVIRVLSLFVIFYCFMNMSSFDKSSAIHVIFSLELVVLALVFVRLLFTKHDPGVYNVDLKVLFNHKTFMNMGNFALYFCKGQASALILSLFSLSSLSIFTSTRILASPMIILTPVIGSLAFSQITTKHTVFMDKKRTIFFAVVFVVYLLVVVYLAEYFYRHFYNDYNVEFLIFTLIHLLTGFIALFRSHAEAVLQGLKELKVIFRANIWAMPISLAGAFSFTYLYGILGAMLALLITESFLLLYYKLKKEKYGIIL